MKCKLLGIVIVLSLLSLLAIGCTESSPGHIIVDNPDEFPAGGADDMGDVDTEAELEAALVDVVDVFTDNDGALDDDDVTLGDVQGALTNDFHNVGGVDDDVPDAGDFGAATSLDANGAINADEVDDTMVDWGTGAGQVSGADIPLDTTNFDNNLGVGDTDVQTAMETLDEVAGAGLTQEQVDDFVAALLNDADSVHTRITLTYDDADDAYDFVVDDMNDDVPDAGDFGAATSLDANGAILADEVDNTMIDWGSGAGQVDADDVAGGSVNKYVTAANVGAVSDNLDDTDASIEWEDAADLESDGSLSATTRIAVLTAAGAITDTNNGPAQTKVDGTNHDYYVCDFDAAADEIVYWDFIIPAEYTGGNITPTVYWIAAATSGAVVWSVQVLGVADSEAYDAALGAAQSVTTTTDGTAGDVNTSTISAFSPSWAAGDLVIVKLFRDADNGSDTMTGDARFLQMQISWPAGWN